MTGRFVGKNYTEYRREFVEHFPDGKQIGNLLDQKNKQKRPQAQNPIFLGPESEKSGNRIPIFGNSENYMKFAHEMSVQNGCDAFANELMRFRIEAKPIWGNIQKHCTNAVII